jgi:hypothetical protein
MNKVRIATITIVVTVILVLAIITSEFYNSKTENLQTPIPTSKPITDVHITNFHFTNFFPAEGMSWHAGFVIEVTNNQTETLDGLTLTFNTASPYIMNRTIGFYNNTSLPNQRYVTMGQPCALGPIETHETHLLYGYIQNNMADYQKIRGYAFNVTLEMGNTVLDQAITMIP